MRASDQVLSSYAEAFVETVDSNRWEPLMGEYRLVKEVFRSFEEISILLASPLISVRNREKILDRLLDTMDVSPETRSFFHLLLKNRRLPYLNKIGNFLEEEIRTRTRRMIANVKAATELKDEELASLRKAIEGYSGNQVELRFMKDPSILGGVIVEAGGVVYDASVKTSLFKLKEALVKEEMK